MSEPVIITDEQLTAYLDGEADAGLRRQIDAARACDPEIEARLLNLELDVSFLQTSFDKMLVTSPELPADLRPLPQPTSQGSWLRTVTALASALALAIGGGLIGWYVAHSQQQHWHSAAATYHALYVEKTLSPVSSTAAQASAELLRVSEALGKSIEQQHLNAIDGLRYKRAQVLGFEERPLVQLAFLTTDGVPVALCIMKSEGQGTQGVAPNRLAGLSAASWIKDGYEYLLLAKTSPERLLTFAGHFRERL